MRLHTFGLNDIGTERVDDSSEPQDHARIEPTALSDHVDRGARRLSRPMQLCRMARRATPVCGKRQLGSVRVRQQLCLTTELEQASDRTRDSAGLDNGENSNQAAGRWGDLRQGSVEPKRSPEARI